VRVVSPECDSIYRAATLVEALANASLKGEK
jgi:hypothetical protein